MSDEPATAATAVPAATMPAPLSSSLLDTPRPEEIGYFSRTSCTRRTNRPESGAQVAEMTGVHPDRVTQLPSESFAGTALLQDSKKQFSQCFPGAKLSPVCVHSLPGALSIARFMLSSMPATVRDGDITGTSSPTAVTLGNVCRSSPAKAHIGVC